MISIGGAEGRTGGDMEENKQPFVFTGAFILSWPHAYVNTTDSVIHISCSLCLINNLI